jgi:hypothetical protein
VTPSRMGWPLRLGCAAVATYGFAAVFSGLNQHLDGSAPEPLMTTVTGQYTWYNPIPIPGRAVRGDRRPPGISLAAGIAKTGRPQGRRRHPWPLGPRRVRHLSTVAMIDDRFVQYSGLRAVWVRWRWVLLPVGTIFEAVLAHFCSAGVFTGRGPD